MPGNPESDLGLGGRDDIAERDPEGNEIGKHKDMSLRNFAITPSYAHNGLFPTLETIVHFYNTRDVANADWQEPEIPRNVNDEELGKLGLSAEEEADLVASLQTLTDGLSRVRQRPQRSVRYAIALRRNAVSAIALRGAKKGKGAIEFTDEVSMTP